MRLSEIRQRQRAHVRQRFLERHDMDMNHSALRKLEGRIRAGDGVRLERRGLREKWLLKIDDQFRILIYDKGTKRVVTVYPTDALSNHPIPWTGAILRQYDSRILSEIQGNRYMVLWRKSKYVKFVRVHVDELAFNVGYNNRSRALVRFADPPNSLSENIPADSDQASLPAPGRDPIRSSFPSIQWDSGTAEPPEIRAISDLMLIPCHCSSESWARHQTVFHQPPLRTCRLLIA
jgi:hypothetical protein